MRTPFFLQVVLSRARSLPAVSAMVMVAACGPPSDPPGEGGAAPAVEAAPPPTVMADLAVTLDALEEKILALADAMSEQQYAWRPMDGVRSVGEVFMHVAADNYFMPVLVGIPAPPETGINMDYSGTVVPYESRPVSRDETLQALGTSFAHLRAAMGLSPPLGEEVSAFGQTSTVQAVWIQTMTHLHEHLGQSIAYARANGVVPPWSRPAG